MLLIKTVYFKTQRLNSRKIVYIIYLPYLYYILLCFQLAKIYRDEPEDFKSTQCFYSLITYFLLSEGFKFNKTNWDINYMKKVIFSHLLFHPPT